MLKELRAKQAKLVAEARARLAEISASTDESRAKELEIQHDAAMAEYDRLQGQIDRIVSVDERDASLRAVDEDRRPGREDRSGREDRGNDPTGLSSDDPQIRAAAQRGLFMRAMQFGVAELDPTEQRALRDLRANLTAEQRAQSVGTTTAGGYTIPQGFDARIIKSLALWGPMMDDTVIDMLRTDTGNTLPMVTVNDTGNTGEDHTENTALNEQDATFGQKTLGAYAIDSGMVQVSLELLQDSAFDFETLLDDLFGDRLGRRANARLTTGNSGTIGIAQAAATGVTAASATAITADELIDTFHSIDPAYRGSPKCAWQFNDSFLKAVRKLKDGQGNYLWSHGDVKSGAPDTLLDKPYKLNQAMANIATGNKVALFGDMSKYRVRTVKNYQMIRLNERFADALQVGFMAWMRLDGLLLDAAAIKAYKMA